jgi:predicted TIM-barrel fold metal-dependent hydrolase
MEYPIHSEDMTYSTYDAPVFDCDFHLYEEADTFTRYLPKEHSNLMQLVQVDGRTKLAVRGRISGYIPNPTFEVVAAPGSGMEYFAGHNESGKSFREIVTPMRSIPEMTDPEARVKLLDKMHVAASLNFPTLASIVEVNFMDRPDLTQVMVHAFNRWLLDEWKFNYDDRIYTTPIINLSSLEGAIAELDFILENGAKAFLMRPAPVAGWQASKSPFLAEFDPFWARVQESGILFVTHASDSGYTKYANEWLGRPNQEMLAFEPDAFSLASNTHRDVQDFVISAVAHGMLARFPEINLTTVELGSSWLPRAVEDLLLTYRKVPQQFAEHPMETIQRALYVAPFWEDPLQPVIDLIGLEHVLYSSDWPHPEGLADPVGFYRWCEAEGMSKEATDKIMGENMFNLLGVKAA